MMTSLVIFICANLRVVRITSTSSCPQQHFSSDDSIAANFPISINLKGIQKDHSVLISKVTLVDPSL